MKLEGEYVFNGPREEVWKLVRDPEVLASVLPGAQRLNKISDSEYEGEMNLRVGPVAGVFSGRLLVTEEVPPESCALSVDAKGTPGFANGTGRVQLTDQGDGTTLMKYEGDLQIGGRLAGVGQRLLDATAKSITRQGLESLNASLQARRVPRAEGVAEAVQVEYVPPTEAQFAMGVARDIAGRALQTENWMQWVIVAQAIAIVLLSICCVRRRR